MHARPATLDTGGTHRDVVSTRFTLGALFLLVGVLPLQWYTLGGGVGGAIKPFHLVTGLLAITVILSRRFIREASAIATLWFPIVVASMYLVAGRVVFAWWRHDALTLPVRSAVYAASGFVVAAALYRILGSPARRHLVWSAPVAAASFVLIAALELSGARTLQLIAQSIGTANPNIIEYQVLRPLFRSAGVEVQPSLRHGVFAAILLAMWLTWLAWDTLEHRRRLGVWAVWFGTALAGVLVLLSLSRATILAGLAGPAVMSLRPLVNGRVSRAHLVGYATIAVAAVVGVASGLGEILWVRFTAETASYSSRVNVLSDAFQTIPDAALTGTTTQLESAAHNFVVQGFVDGGIIVGVSAIAVLALVTYQAIMAWHRYTVGGGQQLAVAVAMVMLPLVRMFTAASGLFVTDWAALGGVAAILAAERTRTRSVPAAADDRVGGDPHPAWRPRPSSRASSRPALTSSVSTP